jgi:hypothetical protein
VNADEVERLITLIQVPTGDDATLRLRDEYTARLVDQGADAQERIESRIESARATNLPVLMTLLAAFGNERAATFLARKLAAGPEPVALIAAAALAAYDSPSALRELKRCAASQDPAAAKAALSALRVLENRLQ